MDLFNKKRNKINKAKQLLPERLQRLVEKECIFKQGPNCWNASKAYHDDNEPIRYVENDQMDEWLEENTRLVVNKKPGDIVVMRFPDGTLCHTMVYLGNGLYFHKAGCGYYSPYEIATLRYIRNRWSYFRECDKVYFVRYKNTQSNRKAA